VVDSERAPVIIESIRDKAWPPGTVVRGGAWRPNEPRVATPTTGLWVAAIETRRRTVSACSPRGDPLGVQRASATLWSAAGQGLLHVRVSGYPT
jgi:hypothetical protein